MNGQQQPQQAPNHHDLIVKRILSSTHLSELSPEEREVVSSIARMEGKVAFDPKIHLSALHKEIARRDQRRKLRLLWYKATTVAAVVVSFLIGAWLIWFAPESNLSNEGLIADATQEQTSPPDNIKVIRHSGEALVVDREEGIVSLDELLGDNSQTIDSPSQDIRYNTIDVPKGYDFRLTLKDGSVMMINSNSRVKIPETFTLSERRIVIESGEVYLEVAKEKDRRFVVQVADQEINVLGTTFNVSAYPKSPVTTTLVSGKVRIHTADGQHIDLRPGQQAVETESGDLRVNEVDVTQYIAWTKGIFSFERMPLSEIMHRLSSWYDFDVDFETTELEQYTFTGQIERSYSKEYIFKLIEKTTDIEISINELNVVQIKNRK